jgi:hypothetical protein
MIKIDIVHNQAAMFLIRDLCQKHQIFGYSSMQVVSAFWPKFRVYDSDPTDPQYYTFIITPPNEVCEILRRLKEDLGQDSRLFICTSPVEQVQ